MLSKEVVNRWQTLLDDHRRYNEKLDEVKAWLAPLEGQLAVAVAGEPTDAFVEHLLNEQETADALLNTLESLGEKTLPETSTQGREKIRQELRDVRDRWDRLDEGIRKLQKRQEAQSLQWSTYQDILQQTLAWLTNAESLLE